VVHAAIGGSVRSPGIYKYSGACESLNTVVARVRHDDVAVRAYCNARWRVELAALRSIGAPSRDECSCIGEFLDSRILLVNDIQVAGPVQGNADWTPELPVAAAKGTPCCDELTARGELLDAIVVGVCHIHVPRWVYGH